MIRPFGLNSNVDPLGASTIAQEHICYAVRRDGRQLASIILRVYSLLGFGIAVMGLIQENVKTNRLG
jgi:hypothetical protein